MRSILTSLFLLGSLAAGLSPAFAIEVDPSSVIEARGGEHALLIWDASTAVAALLRSKTPQRDTLDQLERQALSIAAAKRGQLRSAKDVTVRVVYLRKGSVSPIYGNATFAGVEKLLVLTVSKASLSKHGNDWSRGPLASDVRIRITGKLPPIS